MVSRRDTHRKDHSPSDWVMAAEIGLAYPSNRKKDRPKRKEPTPAEALVEVVLCDVMGPLDEDLFLPGTNLEVDIGMVFADRVEMTMGIEEAMQAFLTEKFIDDELAETWQTVGDVIKFVDVTLGKRHTTARTATAGNGQAASLP